MSTGYKSPADAALEAAQRKGRRRPLGKADAAAPNPAAAQAGEPVAFSKLMADDRRRNRRRTALVGAVTAVLFLASLCLSAQVTGAFYSPIEVLTTLPDYLRLLFSYNLGLADVFDWSDAVAAHHALYDIAERFGITVITLVCGGLLACAGTLYQNVFRNPIAAPTMLGVSNGVQMGILILVLQFGTAATEQTGFYYLYTYLGALIVLALVLGCGRLASGKGVFNVVDMLLVASVISQLCGFVTTYLNTYVLTTDQWLAYYEISEVMSVNTSILSFVSMILAAIAAFVPVFLGRFRMNMLSFSDGEARLIGADPGRLRVLALVCATVMVIVAQVHCGVISMISLVVPHLSRAIFGADFRKQLWGNMLLGSAVLLLCRFLVGCIPFVGEGVPIGTIVSFVTMPLFVWMLAKQQRSWD